MLDKLSSILAVIAKAYPGRSQKVQGLVDRIRRAQINMVQTFLTGPFAGQPDMSNRCCAKRAPRVAGSGLNEDLLEWPFVKASRIRYDIQGDAPSHAKIVGRYATVQILNLVEQGLFQNELSAPCNVHMKLRYLGAVAALGRPEQLAKMIRKHLVFAKEQIVFACKPIAAARQILN